MANEENTDNSDELSDILGEKLEKQEKQLDNSAENIHNDEQQFEKDSIKFIEEIEKNESKTHESINAINQRFDSFKLAVSDFIQSSRNSSMSTVGVLDTIAKTMKWKLVIILVIFAGLFFVPYTIQYFDVQEIISFFDKIPIDISLIPGIVTLIGLLILIIRVNSSINSNLIRVRDEETTNLNELNKESGEIPKSNVKIESRLTSNIKNIQDIKERLAKLLAVMQDYLPGIKEYYSGKSIKHHQEYFALSLRNALAEYNIIDHETERKLMVFSSLTQTEDEWLHNITSKLSKQLKIPQLVLAMCYYDYTNNEVKLKDIWSILIQEQKVDDLVVLLMQKFNITPTSSNKGAFVEIVTSLTPFSLKKFLKLYDVFNTDLEKEKKLVLQILKDVGYNVNEQKRKEILDFIPTTTIYENWNMQLIRKASEVISIDDIALMLVYYDRIGESQEVNKIWKSSNAQENLISSIADMLVDNKIIHIENQDSENLKKICRSVISEQPEFNLSFMESKILEQIQSNNRIKNLIAFALESRNNPIPQKIRLDYFDKVLFSGNDFEKNIAEGLNLKIGIKKEIILLFYYDYIQLRTERKLIYKKIKDDGMIKDLINILKDDPFSGFHEITFDQEDLLEKLIHSKNDFLLNDLASSFDFYKKIIDDINKFTSFLNEQEIKNKGNIETEKIIENFQNENKKSRFQSIFTLSPYIIENQQWKSMTKDEMDAIIFSSLALFFSQYYDSARDDSCKAASIHDLSVKILYSWIEKHELEKQFGQEKTKLSQICKDVFSGTITKFSGITDFKAELQKGVLFSSTKELWGVRLNKIDIKLDELSSEEKYRKLFERTHSALASVMNQRISVDFIKQALTSQMISAYMITRTDGSVIDIVDHYMNASCEELTKSEKDERYRGMLILDSSSGAHTRIGIIPMHIKEFDDFITMFHKAFGHAVKKFEKINPNKENHQFSYNLIRVIPSDLTFKHLEIGGDGSKPDPVETISQLVKTKLGVLDRIKIVASAKEDESPTIALRDIITLLFDNNTNIMSLIGDSVLEIISSNKTFQKIVDDETFDRELKSHYNVTKNTELAKSLFNKWKNDKNNALNELTYNVNSVLKKNKIELTDIEINNLSNITLNGLVDIANILYSSSTN